MLDNIFVYEIKDIIFKQYNFNHEDIIIHTTHTMQAPGHIYSRKNLFGTNSETDKYMEYLKQQILKSIEKVSKTHLLGNGNWYKEKHILIAEGKTQNGYSIGPNMTDDIDRNLTVLK